MKLLKATSKDISETLYIVTETINSIYPNYYPKEVVDYFLSIHIEENILTDILKEDVYLLEENNRYIATATIDENHINRMFVLPEFQGKGYGSFIMNSLEEKIGAKYDTVCLDSSLPALNLYIKRGYETIEYNTTIVENGRVLCYYVMQKRMVNGTDLPINLNGKVFSSLENTNNGEVSASTIFKYYQQKDIIWATYSGGEIKRGYLIGKFVDNNILNFSYQHINSNKEIRIGKCQSIIEILSDGRLRLNESWQWLDDNDKSEGKSIVEEVKKG